VAARLNSSTTHVEAGVNLLRDAGSIPAASSYDIHRKTVTFEDNLELYNCTSVLLHHALIANRTAHIRITILSTGFVLTDDHGAPASDVFGRRLLLERPPRFFEHPPQLRDSSSGHAVLGRHFARRVPIREILGDLLHPIG